MKRKRLGFVGVDSGMVMVGDPCYFVGMDAEINSRCSSWVEGCERVFCVPGQERDEGMDVFWAGGRGCHHTRRRRISRVPGSWGRRAAAAGGRVGLRIRRFDVCRLGAVPGVAERGSDSCGCLVFPVWCRGGSNRRRK